MGAPPRTYMWFFLGPAIYRWLIGTTVAVKGMEWRVGYSNEEDQKEVWRLAEVGLTNSNIALRGVPAPNGDVIRPEFYSNKAPTVAVEVPLFYTYYDSLISGTVRGLVQISGMYTLRGGRDNDTDTSLPTAPVGYSASSGVTPISSSAGDTLLISSRKWGIIQNITDAKLQSPDLKAALGRFMYGKCGKELFSRTDPTSFVNAIYGKGKLTPASIFEPYQYSYSGPDPLDSGYTTDLPNALERTSIPLYEQLKKLLDSKGSQNNSLKQFLHLDDPRVQRLKAQPEVSCNQVLSLLIAGMRWETSRMFEQLMASLPPELQPEELAFAMFYGWNIRKTNGTRLTAEESTKFLLDLIFVHMVRNEMSSSIAPAILTNSGNNQARLSSAVGRDAAELHLRAVASKGKAAEFYQWAVMMPHLQGILLYYLSVAYPFACVILILPGMHKALFQWMAFWAWAKLWDLGFAIVMALERSVWAMLGSKSTLAASFGRIANMQTWGAFELKTAYCTPGGLSCWQYYQRIGSSDLDILDPSHQVALLKLFDRAMAVGARRRAAAA
ncbi:MAG: hypothetical protein EBZ48_13640 [Proteobacteria bacterium]|nr:hypothetical protein [Pseudomonadota bacterium]